VLTIQSSSTAWATQLQLISNDLLATIQKDATGVLIERLVIIGPQTPTWKKGFRTIRNARGPRDTYN
jgi:predicted nucleic acid-binding Zn ribbon protein